MIGVSALALRHPEEAVFTSLRGENRIAIEGAPMQVLHLLNRAILEADTDERFCTIVHAVVEPLGPGRGTVAACAQHQEQGQSQCQAAQARQAAPAVAARFTRI